MRSLNRRPQKRSPSITDLLDNLTNMENGFDPNLVVAMLRTKARGMEGGDEPTEIICDLIEGLWDEVQRLRSLLDQSNVEWREDNDPT